MKSLIKQLTKVMLLYLLINRRIKANLSLVFTIFFIFLFNLTVHASPNITRISRDDRYKTSIQI